MRWGGRAVTLGRDGRRNEEQRVQESRLEQSASSASPPQRVAACAWSSRSCSPPKATGSLFPLTVTLAAVTCCLTAQSYLSKSTAPVSDRSEPVVVSLGHRLQPHHRQFARLNTSVRARVKPPDIFFDGIRTGSHSFRPTMPSASEDATPQRDSDLSPLSLADAALENVTKCKDCGKPVLQSAKEEHAGASAVLTFQPFSNRPT